MLGGRGPLVAAQNVTGMGGTQGVSSHFWWLLGENIQGLFGLPDCDHVFYMIAGYLLTRPPFLSFNVPWPLMILCNRPDVFKNTMTILRGQFLVSEVLFSEDS